MNDFYSLDLETLSLEHNAGIIEIGMVRVDGLTGMILDSFEANPSVSSNRDAGRDESSSVMKWWKEQERKGNPAPVHGTEELCDSLERLSAFITLDIPVWVKGEHFDITILETAYKHFGLAYPWKYTKPRDVRTFELEVVEDELERRALHDMLKVQLPDIKFHRALDDAEYQAAVIMEIKHYIRGFSYAKP